MPTILTSSGTSDNEETALQNAMAPLLGTMNEAAESQLVSRTVEHTPNGFVVHVQVLILTEEEVAAKDNEPEEDSSGGGDKGAVQPARAEHTNVADLAYLQSAQAIERDRAALYDQALDAIAHPDQSMNDPLPSDFEEASQPASEPVWKLSEEQEPILTTLSRQEIDDSVSHEMLSGDVVDWQEGQAAAMARGPKPPEPLPEEEFEEIITPEGKLVRRPKNPPAEDSLDLAI